MEDNQYCRDIEGDARDSGNDTCQWYSRNADDVCDWYNDDDFISSVLCCACGGGVPSTCEDTTNGVTDSYGDTCEWYAIGTNSLQCGRYDNDDFVADSMCCACEGGTTGGDPYEPLPEP